MSDLAPLAESVTVDPLVGHPADFHVFHQFLERCKELPAITTAVVWPLSDVALRGTVEAADEGLIKPTLIGDEAGMKALAAKMGLDISPYPILDADTAVTLACERAFLAVLDGSCRTPIAGHARIVDGDVKFRGMALRVDGSETYEVNLTGGRDDSASLGADAGEDLRRRLPKGFLP